MDFASIGTDELVNILDKYEKNGDIKSVKEIYKILNNRDVESCFWKELFYEGTEWQIKLAASIKKPLGIYEVSLIQSDELFEKIMKKYDVCMDGVKMVLDDLKLEPLGCFKYNFIKKFIKKNYH